MHFTFVFLFCFGCFSLVAQKQVYKAKLQYDMGQYSQARDVILDYLADFPADMEAHLLLAECYYSLSKWNDCVNRIEKIIHLSSVPVEAHELYGKVLKQVGRYEEAKKHFEKFALHNNEKGTLHLKSIEFAMAAMANESKYDIISLPYNSSTCDFGLTFYQNVPVFSSFRTDILMDEMQKLSNSYSGVQKSFFYSNKKHHFIKGMNNKLDGIGPLSFSSNGEYCAMIESSMTEDCNIRCEKTTGVLYLAKINKTGEIIENYSFVHNEVGSSIHSAHIAYDGKALYFSSDRPGGFGGFDIYVSYKKNNFWSLPENLGPKINTSGNELTPYYNNGELYFSSDMHPGFGGYDIFQSLVENGKWSTVKNMEYGINSIGDDYFPVFNSRGEMFITSNRLGGKGKHDIYKAIKVVNDDEPLLSAVEVDLVPPAVSLESLEEKHAKKPENNAKAVSLKNREAVTANSVFVLPEFDRKEVGRPAAEFSLEGARRISMGKIAPTGEVFFIQLASVTHLEPNISKFSTLVRYGNIYKMNVNQFIKIRLGYFTDRKEADEALKNVKKKGFPDAFITKESLVYSNMELLMSRLEEETAGTKEESKGNSKKEQYKIYGEGGKYKVRLASYEDPIWFDINKVKDLGRIEQWTKGSWTIFILAGFKDLEEAKEAEIQAINRGFKTAEVVIDNGGILERLVKN